MARPSIVKGTYIDILVGDGATPEAFSILCGLTTKTFTEQVNSSDIFIPDCADPEDVPVRRLNITGRQWSVAGEGSYNRAQGALIRSIVGVTKNYRFVVSEPTGDDIDDGYYEGQAALLNRQISGPGGGEFATASFQIESDGEWIWHDA